MSKFIDESDFIKLNEAIENGVAEIMSQSDTTIIVRRNDGSGVIIILDGKELKSWINVRYMASDLNEFGSAKMLRTILDRKPGDEDALDPL